MRPCSSASAPVILHVIDGLGPGGAESLLVTNLKRFDRSRHEHLVCTVFEGESLVYPAQHFWRPAIDSLGIPVVELRCTSKAGVPLAIARLLRLIRAHRVSLMHTHLMYANFVGRVAGKMAGVPVLSSMHNLSYEPQIVAGYDNPGSVKHRVARSIESLAARHLGDGLIAVSRSVAESAERQLHVPSSRIRVVYNPVDLSVFDRPSVSTRSELVRELGLPASARLLVNVGRVVPQKAHVDAISAMPRVLERHPDAHLVIVGAMSHPGTVARLRDAIAAGGLGGRVHLVGARRDVPDWLRASDVFVFPSLYEGLPVALAEATALGCACVVSDIAPSLEVVEHRKTGLVFKQGDPRALADAVCELLEDDALRARLSSEASRVSRERFDPSRSASELMDAYDSLLGKS